MRFRQRQGGRFLDRREDQDSMGVTDAFYGAETLQELAEGFVVRDMDFDEITVGARDMVDFLDFGELGEVAAGLGASDPLFRTDADKSSQSQAELFGIEFDFIALDDAAFFQFADPFQDSRRRHADLTGDGGITGPGIFLQDMQNVSVSVVNHSPEYSFC